MKEKARMIYSVMLKTLLCCSLLVTYMSQPQSQALEDVEKAIRIFENTGKIPTSVMEARYGIFVEVSQKILFQEHIKEKIREKFRMEAKKYLRKSC